MSYWNNLKNGLKTFGSSVLNLTATRSSNGEFFYLMGGGANGSAYNFDHPKKYIEAFESCPPLATAVIKLAQYAANGKLWFLNEKDDDEAETDFAKKMKRLFKKPNILQSWKQFQFNYKVFNKLFGFCPVLVMNPAGYNGITDKTQMWILPPWLVDIKLTGKYYSATEQKDLIESVKFNYGGKSTTLELDYIILLRDFNIGIGNCVLPESRLKSLGYPIQTVIDGLRSNNIIIKKRGGIGILSNSSKDTVGSIPLKAEDKKEVQDTLQKNYGLAEDQSEIIITSAALNWQPMSFNAGELKIHESVEMAAEFIVDQVGFNVMLMSSSQNATFNNVNEIKKDVYQSTVIPECESEIESFAEYFKAEENHCRMQIDFSHIECLQRSKKDDATARQTLSQALEREFRNNIITLNQWLTAIEMDQVPGNGDKYYWELVKLGWVFDKVTQTVNANPQAN